MIKSVVQFRPNYFCLQEQCQCTRRSTMASLKNNLFKIYIGLCSWKMSDKCARKRNVRHKAVVRQTICPMLSEYDMSLRTSSSSRAGPREPGKRGLYTLCIWNLTDQLGHFSLHTVLARFCAKIYPARERIDPRLFSMVFIIRQAYKCKHILTVEHLKIKYLSNIFCNLVYWMWKTIQYYFNIQRHNQIIQ